MAIIVCPDCGKEQDNLNKFCRNCGADLSKVEVDSEMNENSIENTVDGEFSQKSIDVPIQKEDGTNSNELVTLDSQENDEDSLKEEIDKPADQFSESSESSQFSESTGSTESGGSSVFSEPKSDENIKEENKESDVNKCSNCGTELKFGEKFCPNCGQSTASLNDDYPKNFCPNCGEKLSKTEKFCPNCGFDLKNISNNAHNKNANNSYNVQGSGENLPVRKEPIVSVILSFVFPGLGQFYNGQSTKAIYFIILAVVSVVLTIILIRALIYLLIWLWSIIDAYNSAEKLNRGEFVEDKLF